MNAQHDVLYYEAHVTIGDVFVFRKRAIKAEARRHGFKLSGRFRSERGTGPKRYILTGRSTIFSGLDERMTNLIYGLMSNGIPVDRFKIEAVVLDSKTRKA